MTALGTLCIIWDSVMFWKNIWNETVTNWTNPEQYTYGRGLEHLLARKHGYIWLIAEVFPWGQKSFSSYRVTGWNVKVLVEVAEKIFPMLSERGVDGPIKVAYHRCMLGCSYCSGKEVDQSSRAGGHQNWLRSVLMFLSLRLTLGNSDATAWGRETWRFWRHLKLILIGLHFLEASVYSEWNPAAPCLLESWNPD